MADSRFYAQADLPDAVKEKVEGRKAPKVVVPAEKPEEKPETESKVPAKK